MENVNPSNEVNKAEKEKREVPKNKIVFCIIACLLTLLFVIWTGYYAVLIMIPVFIDIYITKFVPWGTWRNAKNPTVRKILDWVDAILFALVGVYLINTFLFQNYQIPSSSLEKSLLVGDFLCVSKMSYGTRSPMTPFSLPLTQHTIPGFNVKSYLEKPQLAYQRFAGTGEIHRNDIVVFNYPSGDSVLLNYQDRDYYVLSMQQGRDKLVNNPNMYGDLVYRPVDRRENYVKRCLGLPGDTIEFRDDVVYIDGKAIESPENEQLLYVVQTDGTPISPAVFDELGMSKEDRIFSMDTYSTATPQDSLRLTNVGLKLNKGNDIHVYTYVFLTKPMVEKLSKKPFVLSVIRQNEFFNKSNLKRDMVGNPAYPIHYYKDKAIRHGDFPALWIPKKGETISFDDHVDYKVAAYERCIKNYEFNDFKYQNGIVYINGEPTKSYTFKLDYYFMVGDNRDNSADSRAWGFVPEDHIVGKPLFIWLSLDKDKGWFSGKIRWNRLFTSGNKNK